MSSTVVLRTTKELRPGKVAYYDSMVRIDLSKQESMIALPYHPSNAVSIHELQADPETVLRRVEEDTKRRFGDKVHPDLVSKIRDGKVYADQGIIAGCSVVPMRTSARLPPSCAASLPATTTSLARPIRSLLPSISLPTVPA